MTRPSSRTLLVALLLGSLTVFCLGELVQAAAPSAERMDCASLLCDEQGCEMTTTKHVAPPVGAFVTPLLVTSPAPPTMPLAVAPPSTPLGCQVVPRAPRSPPLA